MTADDRPMSGVFGLDMDDRTTPMSLAGRYIDPARGVILHGEREARVEPRVMEVLLYMIAAGERPVALSELKREVWRVEVVDDAIHRAISQLRKALGGEREEIVATLPRSGYCLVAQAYPADEHALQEAAPDISRKSMSVLIFAICAAFLAGLIALFLLYPADSIAPPAPSDRATEAAAPATAPPAP